MKNIHSYFIHGFNSDSSGWEVVFNNNYNGQDLFFRYSNVFNVLSFNSPESILCDYIKLPFDTNLIKWDSGKIGFKPALVFSAFFSPEAVLSTHDKWNDSNLLAEHIGMTWANTFNSTLGEHDFLLLSAHSLGSCVVYNIIRNLNENIEVGLIIMGGTEPVSNYELLVEQHNNIEIIYNFYSYNDEVLKDILPEFSFCYEPIGICELHANKKNIINIRTNFSHDGYKSIRMRAQFFKVASNLNKHLSKE